MDLQLDVLVRILLPSTKTVYANRLIVRSAREQIIVIVLVRLEYNRTSVCTLRFDGFTRRLVTSITCLDHTRDDIPLKVILEHLLNCWGLTCVSP